MMQSNASNKAVAAGGGASARDGNGRGTKSPHMSTPQSTDAKMAFIFGGTLATTKLAMQQHKKLKPSPVLTVSAAAAMAASTNVVGLVQTAEATGDDDDMVSKTAKGKPTPSVAKKRHAVKYDKPTMRALWTTEEDDTLRAFIQSQLFASDPVEDITWHLVPDAIGLLRNGKQCRDRWFNYLRPGLKKGQWTRNEEELIDDMYKTMGPRWNAMSKFLKNRSDNDIKNKFYSMQRKKDRFRQKYGVEMDSLGTDISPSRMVASPVIDYSRQTSATAPPSSAAASTTSAPLYGKMSALHVLSEAASCDINDDGMVPDVAHSVADMQTDYV